MSGYQLAGLYWLVTKNGVTIFIYDEDAYTFSNDLMNLIHTRIVAHGSLELQHGGLWLMADTIKPAQESSGVEVRQKKAQAQSRVSGKLYYANGDFWVYTENGELINVYADLTKGQFDYWRTTYTPLVGKTVTIYGRQSVVDGLTCLKPEIVKYSGE